MRMLNDDACILAQCTQEGEERLAKLPPKPHRNEQENKCAQTIFSSCRQIRTQFMYQHANEIYAILTDNFKHYYRLSELVFKAAERFPGLVPTRAQIEVEKQIKSCRCPPERTKLPD